LRQREGYGCGEWLGLSSGLGLEGARRLLLPKPCPQLALSPYHLPCLVGTLVAPKQSGGGPGRDSAQQGRPVWSPGKPLRPIGQTGPMSMGGAAPILQVLPSAGAGYVCKSLGSPGLSGLTPESGTVPVPLLSPCGQRAMCSKEPERRTPHTRFFPL
jgi:hypothetical protein